MTLTEAIDFARPFAANRYPHDEDRARDFVFAYLDHVRDEERDGLEPMGLSSFARAFDDETPRELHRWELDRKRY